MRGIAIHLETEGFGRDPRAYASFIRNALRSLIMVNVYAYENDPTLPSIYEAGAVYRREPPGYEQFCDVSTVLRRGYFDCEDGACAVAAWRIVRTGELARPCITWKPLSAIHHLYHITVLRANGTREDPSKLCGMGNEPGEYVQRGPLWVYELFSGRRGFVPPSVPVLERHAA